MRVFIYPKLPKGPDPGDGGIRRVVESQVRHLPDLGWEVVDEPAKADVIACHIDIPAAFPRQFPDTPIVLHNHGLHWTDYEWEPWHYQTNAKIMAAVRIADVVTAVSEWTANALRRGTCRDVRVVYHGIDLEDWESAGLRGDYVLWNKTRADPVCDPEPLMALAREMPEVAFVTTIGQEAPNVRVVGVSPHAEAAALVLGAGVYLATTRETFGVGTLEALASGVPVVGWAWGGQTEIIEHGVDGWLAAPGDIPGLAEGVRWALQNRATIRDACRAKAAKFPAAQAAAEYAAIYAEVATRYAVREERPKVSVIVPAYGLEDYLPATLDSVLAQSFDDWECIVVDDASPDRCGEIADEYAERDARIRVIHNSENLYLAGARNVGIAAARGRYIFPLDADDMIAPPTLELLSHELDRDREIDVAYGNVRFVDEDGETPTDYQAPNQTAGHSGWPMDYALDRQLDGPGQLLPYASMYRREVWELTGGYRERAISSEDCDFWLRSGSYGFRPRYVTRADTLIYRNREGSMSRDQGWEEHRAWYPWVRDRTLLPAIAREGAEVRFPSFDPPQISVVIPVGPDHARYVKDAVDSVEAQTFRGWECIVVNDAGAPLPGLPVWVRVIEPEEGERFGGVAAARNAGIRAARALRYVPLDADDYLQPIALEAMFDAHMEREDRPVVYSDFYEDPETPGEWKVWLTPDSDPAGLIKGLRYAVTALTPVTYWEAVGGYDEELLAWEDWSFQLKLASQGICTRRVAHPLFTYRKHTGFRRNENLAEKEAAKIDMMSRQGFDFGANEAGGNLLACKRCPGGPPTTYARRLGAASPNGGAVAMTQQATTGETVLIEYVGKRTGTTPFRGPATKRMYYFGGGGSRDARKLVAAVDAEHFLMREGFVRVDDVTEPAPVPEPVAAIAEAPPSAPIPEPPLVAARDPQALGATTPQTDGPGEPVNAEDAGPAHEAPQEPGLPTAADREAAAAAASGTPPTDPAPPFESDEAAAAATVPDEATAAKPDPDGPLTDERWRESALRRAKRSDVDVIALKVGVDEPAELPNKAAVIDAIRERGGIAPPEDE